MQYSDKGGLW